MRELQRLRSRLANRAAVLNAPRSLMPGKSILLSARLAAVGPFREACEDPNRNPEAEDKQRDDRVDQMVRPFALMEPIATAVAAETLGLFDWHSCEGSAIVRLAIVIGYGLLDLLMEAGVRRIKV